MIEEVPLPLGAKGTQQHAKYELHSALLVQVSPEGLYPPSCPTLETHCFGLSLINLQTLKKDGINKL